MCRVLSLATFHGDCIASSHTERASVTAHAATTTTPAHSIVSFPSPESSFRQLLPFLTHTQIVYADNVPESLPRDDFIFSLLISSAERQHDIAGGRAGCECERRTQSGVDRTICSIDAFPAVAFLFSLVFFVFHLNYHLWIVF
jgi:hypothetical protein